MAPNTNGLLLDHLPAIFHASEDLRELLAVFEAVLFGSEGQGSGPQGRRAPLTGPPPLVDRIAMIASLFDVYETPDEFLPWLARWVAFFHLDGLNKGQQRQLLAEIVPLYAKRGTKDYLARLLALFIPKNAAVQIEDEDIQGFVVGSVRIGISSWLEPERPFWFRVTILSAEIEGPAPTAFQSRWEERIRRVIDLAKPAHTLYELDWQPKKKD